jgi:hypothetical protein
MQTVRIEYAGKVKVSTGTNPRELYAHQNEAIKALEQKNNLPFEGLLVLPTGGGKTLTAVHWLLRNFIDKNLNEIKERNLLEYHKIKDAVFAKHTDANGFVICAISGFKSQMRRDFQIDHIKPMSKGGLTTIENLQVLSRKAHVEKTRFDNGRK